MSEAKPIAIICNDQLPAQRGSGRPLLLHGQSRSPPHAPSHDHIGSLRQAFRETRARHPFLTDAIVILPDHLHAIWTLPEGDIDFAMRWRLIKSAFSRSLPSGEQVSDSRAAKGERGIWQRRYWEHTLRDDNDLARHVEYIHFNPVKHAHVSRVSDWPYSSFHRMVKLGLCPEDWAGDSASDNRDFGER